LGLYWGRLMGEESSRLSIHVFVCTADLDFTQIVGRALGAEFELRVERRTNPAGFREQRSWWDVILVDLRKSGVDAGKERIHLLDEIRRLDCTTPIVALLDDDDHGSVRHVFEKGAYDTVACPPNIAELRIILRRANRFQQVEKELRHLRSREEPHAPDGNFVVFTEAMQQVLSFTRKIAPCDVSVLVTGETGTGKELLAREIHRLSGRAGGPFVAFSCANLPETLIEDELFGHEKGAFTGAVGARRGRLELSDQGTLFLDEIGDLDLGLQAKLLRVLQERCFERLGSNNLIKVNFRLVCATHHNLEEMVEQKKFRQDLYYRLNVVQIKLPPLRERREGVAVLGYHFLQKFSKLFNKSARRFSPLCLRAMEEHKWPGNIRELENVVQRAVALSESSTIDVWHLPDVFHDGSGESQAEQARSYEGEIREFKRRLIVRTLQECGGNKAESAKALGIARGYLHRLINQLEIEYADSDPGVDLPEGNEIVQRVM
jgi:two-component system, NtrC family, response regulator AtoC